MMTGQKLVLETANILATVHRQAALLDQLVSSGEGKGPNAKQKKT
jgi:hypothetical protein